MWVSEIEDDEVHIELNNRNYDFINPFLFTKLVAEISPMSMTEEIDVQLSHSFAPVANEWDHLFSLLPCLRVLSYGYSGVCDTGGFDLCISLMRSNMDGELVCSNLEYLEFYDFKFEVVHLASGFTPEQLSRMEVHGMWANVDMSMRVVDCLQYRASREGFATHGYNLSQDGDCRADEGLCK